MHHGERPKLSEQDRWIVNVLLPAWRRGRRRLWWVSSRISEREACKKATSSSTRGRCNDFGFPGTARRDGFPLPRPPGSGTFTLKRTRVQSGAASGQRAADRHAMPSRRVQTPAEGADRVGARGRGHLRWQAADGGVRGRKGGRAPDVPVMSAQISRRSPSWQDLRPQSSFFCDKYCSRPVDWPREQTARVAGTSSRTAAAAARRPRPDRELFSPAAGIAPVNAGLRVSWRQTRQSQNQQVPGGGPHPARTADIVSRLAPSLCAHIRCSYRVRPSRPLDCLRERRTDTR